MARTHSCLHNSQGLFLEYYCVNRILVGHCTDASLKMHKLLVLQKPSASNSRKDGLSLCNTAPVNETQCSVKGLQKDPEDKYQHLRTFYTKRKINSHFKQQIQQSASMFLILHKLSWLHERERERENTIGRDCIFQ